MRPSEQSAAYTDERRRYWEEDAQTASKWACIRGYYQRRLAEIYKLSVPPGMRVLELGCGDGELLAKLQPAYGHGIDLSSQLIDRARSKFPALHFGVGDAGALQLDGEFDFILCSDLLNDLWDVQTVFEQIARHCHPGTRVLINCYSRLWEGPRHLAERLGLAKPQLSQNWLTVEDIANLLTLGGFEVVRTSAEIMCPVRLRLLDTLCNRYLVKIWPFRWFGLTNFVVARPVPAYPFYRNPLSPSLSLHGMKRATSQRFSIACLPWGRVRNDFCGGQLQRSNLRTHRARDCSAAGLYCEAVQANRPRQGRCSTAGL